MSRNRLAGVALALAAALVAAAPVCGQATVHYPQHALTAPGAVGQQQLLRGGPLAGHFQPVEILGPEGMRVSIAEKDGFSDPVAAPLNVGMLIGQVYRIKVTQIPRNAGAEVFPTIEVVNRLYPPPGQKTRFPIPVELTREELEMALSGKLVTRVIYLEAPKAAIPNRQLGRQPYYEILGTQDPLQVADGLGRPVAILRMGSRMPDATGPNDAFLFGCPPLTRLPPSASVPALLESRKAM